MHYCRRYRRVVRREAVAVIELEHEDDDVDKDECVVDERKSPARTGVVADWDHGLLSSHTVARRTSAALRKIQVGGNIDQLRYQLGRHLEIARSPHQQPHELCRMAGAQWAAMPRVTAIDQIFEAGVHVLDPGDLAGATHQLGELLARGIDDGNLAGNLAQ